MPEDKDVMTDALAEVGGALGKHAARFIAGKYGPLIVLALAGVPAVRLTELAAALGPGAAVAAAGFCLLLFSGSMWLVRQRVSKVRRSPEMQALIDSLLKRSRGESVSVAEVQLRGGFDRIQNAMASALASQPGINPALAQREIVDRHSALMQASNREAAELRAKETADAERQLAQILANERSRK